MASKAFSPTLTVEACGVSEQSFYIQSATWNGRRYSRTWISHAELAKGGRLIFHMGSEPNPAYSAAVEDRPPSFV